MSTLEANQEEWRTTMSELRGVVESTGRLTESIEAALAEANELTASFERLKDPEARPFDVTEFDAAAVTATEGIRELTRSLERANELVGSATSEEQAEWVNAVLAQGTSNAETLVDRLFMRGLILILTFVGSSFCLFVLYRLVATRVITPRQMRV